MSGKDAASLRSGGTAAATQTEKAATRAERRERGRAGTRASRHAGESGGGLPGGRPPPRCCRAQLHTFGRGDQSAAARRPLTPGWWCVPSSGLGFLPSFASSFFLSAPRSPLLLHRCCAALGRCGLAGIIIRPPAVAVPGRWRRGVPPQPRRSALLLLGLRRRLPAAGCAVVVLAGDDCLMMRCCDDDDEPTIPFASGGGAGTPTTRR